MAIKINRTLYVGIGGTGAKILTKVKRHFIDAYGEVPPIIGFLSIDTQSGSAVTAAVKLGSDLNTVVNTMEGDRVVSSRKLASQDVRLSDNELCGVTVNNALEVYQSQQTEFAFMPKPPYSNVSTLSAIKNAGAGQVRSNGCFIARYNKDKIETSIRGAISRVTGPVPVNSLYAPGLDKNGDQARTTINVVCSMSGGTGSGMLLDVLCIVKELARDCGQKCDIIPWIIMPDIFKTVTPSGSFNVYYNTYGALRDLDFVFQCSAERPIPFGDTAIKERPFEFAYLINNVNSAGATFNSLSDIEDDVAKCAFLPSGDMGTTADEMKDNVIAYIPNRVMGGKQAWAASASAAELIYDSDMMGLATADAIAERLAVGLLSIDANTTGTKFCDTFVDREDVRIRENGGDAHDDVIDSICDLKKIIPYTVEKATTADDVVARLNLIDRDGRPDANYETKLSNTRTKLREYLCELICDKGGLSAAALFLDSMKAYIDVCAGEMADEIKDLELRLSLPANWDGELKACRGFLGYFKDDEAENVSAKVNNRLKDTADLKRHRLAARFFDELQREVTDYKRLVESKKELMGNVAANFGGELSKLRAACKPKSEFQIYLHSMGSISSDVTEGMWNAFRESAAMPNAQNLADWLKEGSVVTSNSLFNFAKSTQPVQSALNYTIEDKLRDMREKDREGLMRTLEALMVRAKPMWTVDYRGQAHKNVSRSLQILVGVSDKENSIMKTDPGIEAFLTINEHKPKYANTGEYQKDRIYLMMQESTAPVFAVNNFKTYEAEYKDRTFEKEGGLSCSVDCTMDNMREAMGFRMWPVEKPQVSLDIWTQAFCFDAEDGQPIVRYDNAKRQYWITSSQFGKAIENYRYDLGQNRALAFKLFETNKLHEEVKNVIDKIVSNKGKKFVDDRLDSFRGAGNSRYVNECIFGNCSPEEEDGLKNQNPAYEDVLAQVTKEINLRTKEA